MNFGFIELSFDGRLGRVASSAFRRFYLPKPDLSGKTIVIITTNLELAGYIHGALETLNAKVIFSKYSPHEASCVAAIGKEFESNLNNVDAVIIHNSKVDQFEPQSVALELIKYFRNNCPVVVCSPCNQFSCIQPIRRAGAKYLDCIELEESKIALAVAEAVKQYAKPQLRLNV